jgi:3'(2'), 5'-bisphosphate nucleotidase
MPSVTEAGETRLVRQMLALSLEAGARIMRIYAGPLLAQEKPDRTPVTEADHAAEAVILEGLARAEPHTPVISEEAFARGHVPQVGRRFFLVDPLDGTKEFLSGNGEFTVNIALIEDGLPSLGVVYAPAKNLLFSAEGKERAFERLTEGAPGASALDSATTRPIHVRRADKKRLVAIASRSHRNPETEEFLKRYAVETFIEAGSSLKFCLIAAGRADLYPRLGTTMEWDTAAGHAVLLAAGGRVRTLEGAPLAYGKVSDGFRNPHFVAEGDLG